MNGNTPLPNGGDQSTAYQPQTTHADGQILRALELIYDPRSSNEHRQDASQYLEQIKTQNEAPYHGYTLAANKSYTAAVRHYGLSLLEHAIRHRWTEYSSEQGAAVREWILKLAQSVTMGDPVFIRNKIAQLWVEVSKRSWVLEWMDMDQQLVMLWNGTVIQKEFVLEVLETLSENSFGKEDSTTALRGNELSKACVEIFTPAQVMKDHFPRRDTSINVRSGDDGWLSRISELLRWFIGEGRDNPETQLCARKALSALKSVINWVILRAVARTHCARRICQCLTAPNQAIQLLAVEALYTLYNRPHYTDDDVRELVWPMYEHDTIDTLGKLYEWSIVEAKHIDEEKYLLCKKFAEMIYNIGRFLDTKSELIPQNADLPSFLNLLVTIVQNESLHISIPMLHLWIQLLDSPTVGELPAVVTLIGPLLEICSQRLLRYEALPENSDMPSIVFLREDIDTIPERHAFLGNYARFCKEIVNCIVQKGPHDALHHILNQTDELLNHLHDRQPPLEVQTYNKTSIAALKLDAQFSVIEASLLGYARWRAGQRAKNSESLSDDTSRINNLLEQWCVRLLNLKFDDPTIKQRIINLAVEFVDSPLKRHTEFVIKVFHFVLDTMTRLTEIPEKEGATAYNEAVKECRRYCSHQLQRLALRCSDHLMSRYMEIDTGIRQYCQMPQVEETDKDRCLSVLFVIMQRASNIDRALRDQYLAEFIQGVMTKWQDPLLNRLLQTFSGFCELFGLSELQNYLVSRRVNEIENWGAHLLDEDGKLLKKKIESAQNNLPLRATKTYLGISVERTEPGTPSYEVAIALWSKYLPTILPNLLKLISLAHSFSDPASWGELPPDLRSVPGRVLRDRYWQVGISSGSRDDFYSQIEGTKLTMEGLASTIRSSLRMVREMSYRVLYSMSLLGSALYDYEELPGPLSEALFVGASALTIHQTSVILTGIPAVIYNCPAHARAHFLPPLVTAMFEFLDQKVSTEWDRIEQRNKAAVPDDDLVEEMKDEAILRQLTNTCVQFVGRLLDTDSMSFADQAHTPSSLRTFILSTPSILKAVILFCTHALRMHDNRACGLITRVLRSLIPIFASSTNPTEIDVREFLATAVLKACIESLHDPYFVDIQSDLASLIARIVIEYSGQTETPRSILLSLPGMTVEGVDSALWRLMQAKPGETRQQRAVVLKLLEGLRGVSVSELGRLPRGEKEGRKGRTAMQEAYMTIDVQPRAETKGKSPELGGLADMFA